MSSRAQNAQNASAGCRQPWSENTPDEKSTPQILRALASHRGDTELHPWHKDEAAGTQHPSRLQSHTPDLCRQGAHD